MAAVTPPPPEAAAPRPQPGSLDPLRRRFSAGERWIHLCLATLMGILIATAAMLYFGSLSALVGHRHLVATVHFYSGLLLPLPLIVGSIASRAFRDDVRRLNRFLPTDGRWLRARAWRDGSVPAGKFNAGQKLNSAFVAGTVLIMFGTGLMLHFFEPFGVDLRTGATLVHDLFASALVIVGAGHIWMASGDPEARRGLKTGWVHRSWARSEHPLWAEEATEPDEQAAPETPSAG
jgi:formate dehydrogenase subunit gamma